MDFVGFNADGFTGWSRHAALCAAAGQETDAISKTVAELEKRRTEIDETLSNAGPWDFDETLSNAELQSLDVANLEKQRAAFDERIAELNTNKENIRKEVPKFAKPISYSNANMLKNAVPNTTAQEQIMTLFHNKQYPA